MAHDKILDFQDLLLLLKSNGCILKGCSKRQIRKIEAFHNVKLPKLYIEFLLSMGKGAGRFMAGSSVFYDEVLDLKEGAEYLLVTDGFKPLPENTFVFWMHQGYQFAFFYLDSGGNPPVYYYYEKRTKNDFEKVAGSLLEFFGKQLI